ncbi:MAG TPA: hypothetical protein RMG45_29835, partial [Polyangiaceae bacterium LLY-WYZ-15_(1-7)]|nr:hypothetical protein [Polyangiaceae bacterium LLY-WYZ-15_(1-7)]
MTRSPLLPLLLAAFVLPLAACDGGGFTPSRDGGLFGDAPAPCEEGLVQCRGRESWVCEDGVLTLDATCSEEQVCALGLGCRDCQPGRPLCVDGDVHLCGEDGTSTTPDRTCEGTSFCSMGACIDPCADAAEYGGEEGCAFVAPAGGEEATVVNRNDADVEVVLEVDGEEVARETLAPVSHVAITLPEAGLATLRTTRPVTAVRQGAEDAALWRPAHTFAERHRVVSWPGEEESRARLVALDTAAAQITLAAAARVGEVEAAAGETVMATLEPGAPLDLIAAPGVDLTGTLVEADGPVGLFVEVRGALAPRIDPEADPEAEPTIP